MAMTLREILEALGVISKKQATLPLRELCAYNDNINPNWDPIVTLEELEVAFALQSEQKEKEQIRLGEILLKAGIISRDQLDAVLDHFNNKIANYPIGCLFVQKGYISEEDLQDALTSQGPLHDDAEEYRYIWFDLKDKKIREWGKAVRRISMEAWRMPLG